MKSMQEQINIITGLYDMDNMNDFGNEDYCENEDLKSWLDRSECYDETFGSDDCFDMDH